MTEWSGGRWGALGASTRRHRVRGSIHRDLGVAQPEPGSCGVDRQVVGLGPVRRRAQPLRRGCRRPDSGGTASRHRGHDVRRRGSVLRLLQPIERWIAVPPSSSLTPESYPSSQDCNAPTCEVGVDVHCSCVEASLPDGNKASPARRKATMTNRKTSQSTILHRERGTTNESIHALRRPPAPATLEVNRAWRASASTRLADRTPRAARPPPASRRARR